MSGAGHTPTPPADDLERLWRFLLDEMGEEEKVALEDELLVDGEGFAIVESAEDELIDAYARGELPVERRRRFEQRFLATASQRARVALADALATLAAKPQATTTAATTAAATTTTATTQRALRDPDAATRPPRRLRPLILRATAAAILLGAFGVLAPRFLGRTSGTETDATLYASSLRGDTIATVRLPAHTSRLRLRLQLAEPLPADAESVDALLRREDGTSLSLATTRTASEQLAVAIDASALATGSYELTARAHRRAGAVDDLATYAFRIDAR
jgi:anti-sigma factor RsiW